VFSAYCFGVSNEVSLKKATGSLAYGLITSPPVSNNEPDKKLVVEPKLAPTCLNTA
jgi:hypothetical protein